MAEADAIARLLADPDPGVAASLRRQLAQRPEDPPGLREAVEALEDPAERARARDARLEVSRERAAERLLRLARVAGEPSLEEAAFEVARTLDPDVDVVGAVQRLDALGSRLRDVLDGGPVAPDAFALKPATPIGPRQRLTVLSWFLGEQEGFEGDQEEYDSPRNSILPEVLERKRGLPIALSVVYLLVAARAGIPLYGVGAPQHFIVGGPADGRPLFLDPFRKGQVMEASDVADVQRALGVAFRPEYLAPTGPRRIIARMARNLVQYYGKRPRGELRARRFGRIAEAFEGDV